MGSSSGLRWICPYCPGSNNSWEYDTSCPLCFKPRPSGAVGWFRKEKHSRVQTEAVRGNPDVEEPIGGRVLGPSESLTPGQPKFHLAGGGEPFTDSGYASYGVPVQGSHLKTLMNPLATIPWEPKDESKEVLDQAHDNDAYAATVYSEGSEVDEPTLQSYINEFALSLCASISPYLANGHLDTTTTTTTTTVLSVLPELLEAFAFRVGLLNSSPPHKRLMVFVYKYRRRIVDRVKYELMAQPEDDLLQRDPSSTINSEEKVLRWIDSVSISADHEESQDSKESLLEAEEDPDLSDLLSYRQILQDSPAYDWLVSRLKVGCSLDISQQNYVGFQIKRDISSALGPTKEIRRSAEQSQHSVIFTVHTDMLGFFTSQGYDTSPEDTLANTICLAGTMSRGQATTCQEYMAQTWPHTGIQLLELFKRALKFHGHEEQDINSDRTKISVLISERSIRVFTRGIACCLAEVAEQISWLTSAIRCSDNGSRPSYVEAIETGIKKISKSGEESQERGKRISCDITFRQQVMPEPSATIGGCWQRLFRNPAMVANCPILQRPQEVTGVEMSLQMMGLLCDTDQTTLWDGRAYIKGFCTMLVPTKLTNGIVTWHVLFNDSGNHISFADTRANKLRAQYPEGLKVTGLDSFRHVVGWCGSVRDYIGSPDANYSIKWSGLGEPGRHFAFERVTISGGKFITGAVSIALGKKDRATQIRNQVNYTERMRWISKKFVVLYDVGDKRAWLSNGLSVLLHLVRTSLKHDANDHFKDHFLFDPTDLQESAAPYEGLKAAIDVLLNSHNQSLPLYANPNETKGEEKLGPDGKREFSSTVTSTHSTLRHRVDRILDLLEQIVAHQEQDQDEVGYKVKAGPRKRLEGFNFKDIATLEDPFRPCFTNLQRAGRGWVDFTRAIHAITLFGNGFGALLSPESKVAECSACLANSDIPVGMDYLAVGVTELKALLEKQGSPVGNHWSLARNTSWHTQSLIFQDCSCKRRLTRPGHPHRIQVLLPTKSYIKFQGQPKGPNVLFLPKNGAVFFGYTKSFPISWPNFGVPRQKEIGEDDSDSDDEEELEERHGSSTGSNRNAESSNPVATAITSEPSNRNRKQKQSSTPSSESEYVWTPGLQTFYN